MTISVGIGHDTSSDKPCILAEVTTCLIVETKQYSKMKRCILLIISNNNIIIIGIYIAPFPFVKCLKALHIVIV